MFKKPIAASMIALMLTACASPDGTIRKQDTGALMGAVGGAIVGSNVGKGKGNIAAIAAGTLLGAALGQSIGASLDRADMQYHDQTAQRALENSRSGESLPWQNPQSGHSGTITPINVVRDSSGQYCREYTQTVNVGGRTEQAYGMACRQPDGTWRIQQ
ncbi:MAG: glycine zipper 2TM domain-containing protein [Alphaproteobacteria bacterium]|nr:glycine zipper 2TM domain-containing protein [Alphaproteobacteria bacterium]